MRIDSSLAAALFAATMQAAWAQSGAPVEGQVRNQASGAGVAGANVTFFKRDEFARKTVRYQAVTDASGAFKIADVEPGQYQAMLEKSGFAAFPENSIQVARGGAPIVVQYQMPFGIAPRGKLRGRVLDSKAAPAAGARVILIRGPELRFTTETDTDGRFSFAQLDEGSYTLLAAPAMRTPAADGVGDVASYFPSAVVVHGDAEIDGFQLQTAPVFRVRGVVMNSAGRPAARATVTLAPVTQQPAHVVWSFESQFLAVGEGPGFGPEVARATTGDDGSFEFASVPKGQWNIAAEGAGAASVAVTDRDVAGVRISMVDPIALEGSAKWGIRCVWGRLACGPKVAEGAAIPVWLRSAGGQANALQVAVVQTDGTFQLDNVRTGNYFIQPLPPLLNGKMVMGARPNWIFGTRHDEAVDLGRRDPLNITLSVALTEGGPVILDTDHPVDLSNGNLKMDAALSGSVHGMVKDGGGTAVVLLPEQFAEGTRGALAYCRPDGSFDAIELGPGSYRVAAFRGIDMEALRDPELLARVIAAETKVKVALGETSQVVVEKVEPAPGE